MVPLVTGVIDAKLFAWLAQFATGIALWAALKAQTALQDDPLEDLTERLRHPIRWRLSHPIRAMRRGWTRVE